MNDAAALRFRRLGMLTICAVYLVILAGGIVRASGAGMGCPDWPTCFGQWIPPTSEAQLPANYHEIYAQRGYENTQFNIFSRLQSIYSMYSRITKDRKYLSN